MVAVAIFSIDPGLRRDLEQLPGDDPAVAIVGMADQLSSLRELVDRNRVDVLVADTPTRELLTEYRARHDRIALVVLLEGEDAEAALQALGAGASAALDRSASRNEIIAAVKAVATGLVVVPSDLLATLLPRSTAYRRCTQGQWCRARPIDSARARSACGNGGWCLKQSDRPPARYFIPHCQVSRRRDTRQA